MSKERLTYRTRIGGEAYLRYGVAAKWEKMPRYDILNNSIQKLAEYEDLEDQGLLLRLPCKVGDTVWNISFGVVLKCKVKSIGFERNETLYVDYECGVIYSFRSYLENFGKTVFLTQAEAEDKLRELEKDEITENEY